MNAFAAARLELAIWRCGVIAEQLEGAVDQEPRALALRTRGDLVALKQLLELEDEMGSAKTDPSGLRLVK